MWLNNYNENTNRILDRRNCGLINLFEWKNSCPGRHGAFGNLPSAINIRRCAPTTCLSHIQLKESRIGGSDHEPEVDEEEVI